MIDKEQIARLIYEQWPDIQPSQFEGPTRRTFEDARSRGYPRVEKALRIAASIAAQHRQEDVEMREIIARLEPYARAVADSGEPRLVRNAASYAANLARAALERNQTDGGKG